MLDWDACFSVKCHNCPVHFCGWCMRNCGRDNRDAHQHVAQCALNPRRHSGDMYGTPQELNVVLRDQRVREIRAYVRAHVDAGDAQRLMNVIRRDLADLGIPVAAVRPDVRFARSKFHFSVSDCVV